MEPLGSRNLVFACDDSLAAEEGARFLMERFARPGDVVHFVHVIPDNRSPFVSVVSTPGTSAMFDRTRRANDEASIQQND